MKLYNVRIVELNEKDEISAVLYSEDNVLAKNEVAAERKVLAATTNIILNKENFTVLVGEFRGSSR